MSDPVLEKYPDAPAGMDGLLERIETEWLALREFVLGLSQEQLTRPGNGGWSVKDHMVHLTFWEQMMVRSHLGDEPQHVVLGLSEADAARLDSEDAENDLIFRRNRDRTLDDVLSDAWRTHDETVRALARVPYERLQEPRRPGDSDPMYAYVVGNTYGHYMEHAGWLREQVSA